MLSKASFWKDIIPSSETEGVMNLFQVHFPGMSTKEASLQVRVFPPHNLSL